MPPGYVPDAGDIVLLQFDRPLGQTQVRRHAAVVISPASYNGKVGRIICCPTTSRRKGYPFEVTLADTPHWVVLTDQVKSQDWREGQAILQGQVSATELAEVRAKLIALIA